MRKRNYSVSRRTFRIPFTDSVSRQEFEQGYRNEYCNERCLYGSFTGVPRDATVSIKLLKSKMAAQKLHRYLRKALFPVHSSLRHAGLLPPTDMPHHLRRDDASPYREGVIIENYFNDSTIYVDVGLNEPVQIPTSQSIPPNTRVTVQMPSKSSHGTLSASLSDYNHLPIQQSQACTSNFTARISRVILGL